MRLVDELLEDEQLLDRVYEAQGERHPQSRRRGRMQTLDSPAGTRQEKSEESGSIGSFSA
jgi:hypothetical protein